MKATTAALYAAANAAFDYLQAAKAEAFRSAAYGTASEAAKAMSAFTAAAALEKAALRAADDAHDADLAAA
jgi:hypothetical protein